MTNELKEQLREAVLTLLAGRPTMKLSVSEISRRIKRAEMVDGEWTEPDVREALALLEGLGFAAQIQNQLGAGISWKATAQGVLYRERNLS